MRWSTAKRHSQEWRRWFAWRPVEVKRYEWRWLCYVECRHDPDVFWGYWRYRDVP